MPRRYLIYRVPTSYTVQLDAIEIGCADDKMTEVLAWGAFQEGTGDVGDAAEETFRGEWIRGHTTSGSGGAAYTPIPIDGGDAAYGGAVEVGNTTIASAGTGVVVGVKGLNVRAEKDRPFTPEERIYTTQALGLLVLRVPAPADALVMGWWAHIQEWG